MAATWAMQRIGEANPCKSNGSTFIQIKIWLVIQWTDMWKSLDQVETVHLSASWRFQPVKTPQECALEKICQNLRASELRQVWVLSSWAPSPRWGRASAACGPATCKTQTSRCNKQKKTENRLPKSKCHFHIGTFAITWNCMETWPSRMHKSSQAHGLEAGTKKAEVHLLLLEPQRQSSTILLPQLKMVKKWKDCLGLHTTSQDCKFRIHHHLWAAHLTLQLLAGFRSMPCLGKYNWHCAHNWSNLFETSHT